MSSAHLHDPLLLCVSEAQEHSRVSWDSCQWSMPTSHYCQASDDGQAERVVCAGGATLACRPDLPTPCGNMFGHAPSLKVETGPKTRPDRGESGLWLGVSPDGLAPRANRDSSMGSCSRDETLAWHCKVLPLRLVSCRCPPDPMHRVETKRTVLSAGCMRSEHSHCQ